MPNQKPITLTVLIENDSINDQLEIEHGLSLCLQGDGWQTVFDTGQSDAYTRNATRLGIDLRKTTELVFSHGHYDHTAGLVAFPEQSSSAKIFCHPDTVIERYSVRELTNPRMIGIPPASLEELNKRGFTKVSEPLKINDRLHMTGEIPRVEAYEDVGGPFFLDSEATKPDPINDDQALWFNSERGLVIVLGCAHAGIINTIRLCREQSGIERIHALIGGFHLVNANESRLEKTIEALREIAPDRLAACHCTGSGAVGQLKDAFPETFTECHAGSVFTFS